MRHERVVRFTRQIIDSPENDRFRSGEGALPCTLTARRRLDFPVEPAHRTFAEAPRIRAHWPDGRLPRWAHIAIGIGTAAALVKVGMQIFIQLSPRITPPAASFLLHSRIRRGYRRPDQTIDQLQLASGHHVLEVGGGTGTFTVPIAKQVAPEGKVYSIELQSAMLRQQARRVAANGATNARLHRADALHLPFAGNCFDRAVVIAVLPMLRDKQRALREIWRILKPGALLAVSEELAEPEYVPPIVTRRWCERADFQHVATYRERWFYVSIFERH